MNLHAIGSGFAVQMLKIVLILDTPARELHCMSNNEQFVCKYSYLSNMKSYLKSSDCYTYLLVVERPMPIKSHDEGRFPRIYKEFKILKRPLCTSHKMAFKVNLRIPS